MKRLGWWIAFAFLTAAAILFTVFNLGTAEIDLGLWSGAVPVFAVVLASLLVPNLNNTGGLGIHQGLMPVLGEVGDG